MSSVTKETCRDIAHLARIELDENELETLAPQLESILAYMDQLAEVDLDDAEPFLSAAAAGNVMREDMARPSLDRDAALQSAPRQADGFFKVPPVQ